jgi:ribonuclease Z
VSSRELIALGTSSQAPTRERSHNAYMLRWDGECFLFDPGEGAQRQLIWANIAACSIYHICITHFHGDHCLGLAGIVQRLSQDRCNHCIHIYYPESGQIYIERLCGAAIFQSQVELKLHPAAQETGKILELHHAPGYTLKALPLDHSVPTIGYRLEETDRLRFLPEKLDQMGIHGPMVGELQRKGMIHISGIPVRLEEVTAPRRGNMFAFVMDTRPCAEAVALGKHADLLVMEATYTSEHRDLANAYAHSTAADAATTALAAGAHCLALGHFSQRYPNSDQHLLEAKEIFPNVIVLNDLDRVSIARPSQPER